MHIKSVASFRFPENSVSRIFRYWVSKIRFTSAENARRIFCRFIVIHFHTYEISYTRIPPFSTTVPILSPSFPYPALSGFSFRRGGNPSTMENRQRTTLTTADYPRKLRAFSIDRVVSCISKLTSIEHVRR